MNRTDNLMDKPDTMTNEETETSDIVENPAPGSPIPQGSVRDEIAIAAENGVNEREDGSGSLEAGQGVTDIENKDGDEEEAENKDCVPLAFVKASEYCLLCRARFPVFDSINQPNRVLYYKWRSKNPDEPWQSQIRAVVQLDKDEGESIAVTDVVELKRNPTKATLIGWPSSSHISIKPDPMLDDPIDQLASCFHDWCYSIFTWEFGHDNLELLYQMGTSLQPASAWQMPAEMKGPLYPQVNCDNLLSGVDSKTAMFQPLQIAKLPPEIRCRIWNFVGPTSAYSAFMILIGETSTLARQMRAPAVRELAIKPGYYLEPSIINMYGTQYIQALVTQKDSSLGVKVVGTVTKIQVVSSVHGVCSIRLLGRNWESKWLGTIPRMGPRWYGEITLENNVLVCFYNGLAIEEVAGNHQPHMRQVMWDRPDHPGAAFDADGALFTFFAPQELYRRIQPVLGFFRFIPLTAGDVYASGITVHFLSRFMTGIEAHFSTTSHLVGSRSEMAVYFPLASSERISNVWLRFDTFAATASAPSMLIRTTLGRDYTFGPYINPEKYPNYRWVMLKKTGCITGFYFENSPKIRRLGVIGDGKPSEVDQVPLPRYETCDPTPPYIGFLGRNIFMNDAKIQDLKSVMICKVGRRCIGMLIRYMDTTIPTVVLGQWLDSELSKHVCIFDIHGWAGLPPSMIAFKMSESETFVQDIEFCSTESELMYEQKLDPDIVVQIYEVGTRIAWWFTGELDSIRLWKPRPDQSSSIPVEYELIQD